MSYENNNDALEVIDIQDELLKDPDYLKIKNRIQALLVKRYLERDVNIGRPKFEVEIEWADSHSKKFRTLFNTLFSLDKASIMEALSSPASTDAFLAQCEEKIDVADSCVV